MDVRAVSNDSVMVVFTIHELHESDDTRDTETCTKRMIPAGHRNSVTLFVRGTLIALQVKTSIDQAVEPSELLEIQSSHIPDSPLQYRPNGPSTV